MKSRTIVKQVTESNNNSCKDNNDNYNNYQNNNKRQLNRVRTSTICPSLLALIVVVRVDNKERRKKTMEILAANERMKGNIGDKGNLPGLQQRKKLIYKGSRTN